MSPKLIDTEILFDRDRNIYIYAPITVQKKICGLCGYYNGMAGDDYQNFNRVIQKNVNQFVEAWIDRDPSDRNSYPERDIYPCNTLKTSNNAQYQNALTLCQSMVKNNLGSTCQAEVKIDRFLDMCQDEICECVQAQQTNVTLEKCYSTFCRIMEQYSYACTQKGISVDWRSSSTICSK